MEGSELHRALDIASCPLEIPDASQAKEFRARPGGLAIRGFSDQDAKKNQQLSEWPSLADRPVSEIVQESRATSSGALVTEPARYHDIEQAMFLALKRDLGITINDIMDPTLGSLAGAWAFSRLPIRDHNKEKYWALRAFLTCAIAGLQHIVDSTPKSPQHTSDLVTRWNKGLVDKLIYLENWAQDTADRSNLQQSHRSKSVQMRSQEWRKVVLQECLKFWTSVIHDDGAEFQKYSKHFIKNVEILTLRVSVFISDCAPWSEFSVNNSSSREYGKWEAPYTICMLSQICDKLHRLGALPTSRATKSLLERLIRFERGIFNCWRKDILIPKLDPLSVTYGASAKGEGGASTVILKFGGGRKFLLVFSHTDLFVPSREGDAAESLLQGAEIAASIGTQELRSFSISENEETGESITFGVALKLMAFRFVQKMRMKCPGIFDLEETGALESDVFYENEREGLQLSRILLSVENLRLVEGGESSLAIDIERGVDCIRDLFGSIVIQVESRGITVLPNKNFAYWLRALLARFPTVELKGITVGPVGIAIGIVWPKRKRNLSFKSIGSSISSANYIAASALEENLEDLMLKKLKKRQEDFLQRQAISLSQHRERAITRAAATLARSLIEAALVTSPELSFATVGEYSSWTNAYRSSEQLCEMVKNRQQDSRILAVLYDADRIHVALLAAHYVCSNCGRHLLHYIEPITAFITKKYTNADFTSLFGIKLTEINGVSESVLYFNICPCGLPSTFVQRGENNLLLG